MLNRQSKNKNAGKYLASAVLAVSLLVSSGVGEAAGGTINDSSNSIAGASSSVLGNKPLYELHTLAGTGAFSLSNGAKGTFNEPSSIAYDSLKQRWIVADTRNQLLRSVNAKGTETLAGMDLGVDDYYASLGGLNDGEPLQAAFDRPTGLTVGQGGTVYIADTGNHAVRMIDSSGRVKTLAGNGEIGLINGKGAEARFHNPLDVAVTKEGIVYVADTLNHVIRKIDNGTVTTLNAPSTRVAEVFPGVVEVSGDYKDGPLKSAKFNEPSGLALDGKGNLYVSDTGNQTIRYIDFTTQTVTTIAGWKGGSDAIYAADSLYAAGGFADGKAQAAKFHAPRGLSVTSEGGLLIADSLNHVIRYYKNGIVSTVAGIPGESSDADGPAHAAGLNKPTDVVWMNDGTFVVADSGNSKIRIVKPYKLPAGVQTTNGDGGSVKSYQLLLNDTVVSTDAPIQAVNGTLFVPVRVLTEKLGFVVHYNKETVTLSKGNLTYTLQLGKTQVSKGTAGQKQSTLQLGAAPFNQHNRMYVPVRFFAEEIGLDVQWLPEWRVVLLREGIGK